MNAELGYLGLREVAELLRERKLSAREFMRAQLARGRPECRPSDAHGVLDIGGLRARHLGAGRIRRRPVE